MKEKPSPCKCSIFGVVPVIKLSMAITSWPFFKRYPHKCDPKNPAPPVTKVLGMKSPLELIRDNFQFIRQLARGAPVQPAIFQVNNHGFYLRQAVRQRHGLIGAE